MGEKYKNSYENKRDMKEDECSDNTQWQTKKKKQFRFN